MPESQDNKERLLAKEDQVERQLTSRIDAQAAEIRDLSCSTEKYAKQCKIAQERIAGLKDEFEKVSRSYRVDSEKREQRIRAMEAELTCAKELLAARTAELAGARSVLATADSKSEADVLGTVCDLNESIFQLADNLTEEWEELVLSRPRRPGVSQRSLDDFSNFYGSALIYRASHRDPAAVKILVQTCLCYLVAQMTSSWRCQHNRGDQSGILGVVYKRLSVSETQAISGRWRSLTHNYLTEPSLHDSTESITKKVANHLWITGSFQSSQSSFEFVKAKASKKIEAINLLVRSLESMFMVGITSSDMHLLSEPPRAVFDNTRMAKEFESDDSYPPRGRNRVAGTTEVGVGKSMCGMEAEGPRMQVLLKPKVVLESDLADP